ncbi:hypothetical protein [Methanobrevibacter sp.]|uniref:hypothetical protein n=1 Tax=Methanobrevibacter sp. TaxID=66852 RepID=UPI003870ED92
MCLKNILNKIFPSKEENEAIEEVFNEEIKEFKPYAPFYDDYMDLWNVKDTRDDECYPMTGEPMAREISELLNNYYISWSNISDELFKKDRKFEELGFDLDELDEELGIGD